MHDYGTAWRNLRPKSLTDQILIKAQRIKSIEEKKFNFKNKIISIDDFGFNLNENFKNYFSKMSKTFLSKTPNISLISL